MQMICEISELEPDEDDMTMMSRKTARKRRRNKHHNARKIAKKIHFYTYREKKAKSTIREKKLRKHNFTPIEKKKAKSTSERRTMSANVCSGLEITPFISTNISKRMLARRYNRTPKSLVCMKSASTKSKINPGNWNIIGR